MSTVKIVLPRPHAKQQIVLDSKARFKVLLAGRRFGKTLICMVIALNKMLQSKKVAYVAPTGDDCKDFYRDLIKYIPEQLIKTNNKSELYIELITGGTLKFYSGEVLDRFRGKKYHLTIIDEAAIIPDLEEGWNNAIRPTLSDYRGEAIFISTPRGKNYFYSLFIKGKSKENGYESFHFPSNCNPHFHPDEFEEARKSLPTATFNQEYLAIPLENEANPFGTEYIAANTIKTLSTKPPVVIGLDVARSGDFCSFTSLDQDGVMCAHQHFQAPWEITKQKIKQLPSDVLKVLDATGVGSVLLEELQQTVPNLIGFTFTTESKPKLIFELIQSIEAGKLKFNEKTADELLVFEYKYSTASNQIKYQAQSGFHDDCVISLALCNKYRNQALANANWQLFTL